MFQLVFRAIEAAKLFTFSKAKMLQQSSSIANHTPFNDASSPAVRSLNDRQFCLQRDDREPRPHAGSTSLLLPAISHSAQCPQARTDGTSSPSQRSGSIRSWLAS